MEATDMKKILVVLMVIALTLGTVLPSATGFASSKEQSEAKEYLVMFDGAAEKGILQAFGIEKDAILHEFELLPVKHIKVSPEQAKGLANHPQIKFVEENIEFKALGEPVEKTMEDSVVSSDQFIEQTVPWGVTRVQATQAHPYGINGNGMRVAVLDTGIDRNHSDLQANVRGGYSVFTDSANRNPYHDPNGHGTHVAGTVAAANNGSGVLGVAPRAQLYAVKVLNNSGSGSLAGIAQGIEWSINNNMHIINMSLGTSQHSSILQQYCNLAYNRGILVVAAAGNSGNSWGSGDNVAYPARYSSVIAVAATDSNNRRGSFSSTGPAVEIAAPGVNVLSTLPNNRYGSLNGTSMASPHVAGVAALVWQYKPHLSNVQLRNTLNATAQNLGNSNHFGHGLVRAMNALTY